MRFLGRFLGAAQVPDCHGRVDEGEVEGTHSIGARYRGSVALVSERAAPVYLRSDNGPEFVSRALMKWIVAQGIETALIDPGKPWQNGSTESFNGKFRDECLSLEWFRSRAEAKVIIETWRRHFNEVRPHSRLGYQTPAAFAAQLKAEGARRTVGPATGRTAAVSGASALHPVAQPCRKGQVIEATRGDHSS